MTSHVDSSPSLTPSQEGSRLPSEIAEAFLSWQPTVPSSWVTPPGSDSAGTSSSPCSGDSSPIRQDYYIPQMLIYTTDNLHLHAAHTPYSTPTALDAEDTCSHTSANSFPCPMPELIPHTNCYGWTSLYHADTSDCLVSFFPFPHSSKPMYDTICRQFLYDINLRATLTMILSIRGVTIPIYLVSSATDSIRQCIVLFKAVPIPTSDPKSEFLCQSSSIVQKPQTPPKPPCTPGRSPTLSSPRITRTVTVQVLSLST